MYSLKKQKNDFKVIFSATFEEIDRVCRDVKDFLTHNGLEHHAFDVLLGVREVLTNAVRHGSKQDATKEITFQLFLDGDRLRVHVSDQGPGFDWKAAARRHASASSINGRGISILQMNFDFIQYNQTGNEVELVKKVTRQGIPLRRKR